MNTFTYKVITCLFRSDSVSTNTQTSEGKTWQTPFHLTPVHCVYLTCILCALLTCTWRIIRMGELWTLLPRLLSFSRKVLRQTKDPLSLHSGISICSWAKCSQWICLAAGPCKQLVLWQCPACDTGTRAGVWWLKMTEVISSALIWEQIQPLLPPGSQSRVVFLQLKSLFCDYILFISQWVWTVVVNPLSRWSYHYALCQALTVNWW